MKDLYEISRKEWSFYAFIFLSPVTFLLYAAFFGFPGRFAWIIPHLLSFLCSAVFFVIFIHNMRSKMSDIYGRSKVGLAKDLVFHALKTYGCIFPFQIGAIFILGSFFSGQQIDNHHTFPSSIFFIMVPISFFLSVWFFAGFSFVIYRSSSKGSIRHSFSVMKILFKPISILVLILFTLNGFAWARQSTMGGSSVFFILTDILPLYFAEALTVLGILYIVKQLIEINYLGDS